ncbi:asparaginyl/glutamyl-tRNA amidotransferase subunit C [Candidatus Uhrbacteria bacterium RIFCSPLOWO2_12_FULL_46_10]|uniref:Aspartyl/glutamyl-tRNA(Asn/Gln) amidotransferase subunit C n=1 Tax=Candidatus Uhrbacteria bacterium RIFCSPLOWO2_01_FULL_47_25 TaxID=1802402 RepID=A0A1F7UYN2_9BACT|nr:MAG: Aspartyl/glutamyl-tRNA(Asn/Gln) amidotransferase subunit C [Parcubacteria group bacterium GW2011_GWA2_46_9]OGL60764.1 MAG: asparaginyl/glutamyl-tRNA amidotransferase subunit C [Candidatus Uhrbacteria bacterium RIFCSPHIGHO2_01_FULL_46_23]OGL70066.1 MAG: asparaginyl/glutamyl-tRNA amidotransferase subunit C [Candidatus Uhrbacteria bacterium RIFCSPHIGHO2_02_FULL_47_29]OGL75984.1 MAG: asparaginyl/glutamyl-tRNA amidotransferase subunit C [Candidatus Uhrbacteria bacterium RIFCSPHIGHO2_12_FULL_4
MSLTREEVKHIAALARLELTEDEITRYQKELARILDYVGQLQEVDTAGIEPTAQVTGLVNRLREDKSILVDEEARKCLLSAAPDREGDYFKVKAVFE